MNYKTLQRVKLTKLVSPEDIYAITPVVSPNNKRALVVVFKRYPNNTMFEDTYGRRDRGAVIYVGLSKFTYEFPIGVPIPKESYCHIQLIQFSNEYDSKFINARLTKVITWQLDKAINN